MRLKKIVLASLPLMVLYLLGQELYYVAKRKYLVNIFDSEIAHSVNGVQKVKLTSLLNEQDG